MNFLTFTPKRFFGLVFTGLAVASGSVYFRKKIEDNLGNFVLTKSSIEDLLQHKPSIELLGEPISWKNPSLSDQRNRVTASTAYLAIPVAGPKNEGFLLIDAQRQETDTSWTLNTLKLKFEASEVDIKS